MGRLICEANVFDAQVSRMEAPFSQYSCVLLARRIDATLEIRLEKMHLDCHLVCYIATFGYIWWCFVLDFVAVPSGLRCLRRYSRRRRKDEVLQKALACRALLQTPQFIWWFPEMGVPLSHHPYFLGFSHDFPL